MRAARVEVLINVDIGGEIDVSLKNGILFTIYEKVDSELLQKLKYIDEVIVGDISAI